MTRIEVLKIMAHLVITLTLIIGYILILVTTGKADQTFQGAILLSVGYWFGKIGLPNKKGSGSNEYSSGK